MLSVLANVSAPKRGEVVRQFGEKIVHKEAQVNWFLRMGKSQEGLGEVHDD